MTDSRACPHCGTPLLPDALEGVCPNCVLALAQATRTGPSGERALRIKCPHCGNGIQLVHPDAREVTCDSCGSSFRLEPCATTPYHDRQHPESIGKFQVIHLLGRGAFGSVYKARDPELDRIVAIKVPRAGYFRSQQEEERFLREARSAARLGHPGIVPVHEIAHAHGVPFLVSDYVEAVTLADVLTGTRPGYRETAELVARVAEALDFAHRAGIVHRDIKPGNILIDRAGLPHLTDFGLARRDDGEITVTLEGQILGTPAYMSPEQATGAPVDGRSDVYSLGVVLYEMLTGELPVRGNQRIILYQVVYGEPRAPRSLNDRIPRDLETICLTAMAKQPARRYATAGALAGDLRRYLKREPIKARPVGATERLWRWSRRNPMVASLSASLLIVLIAGLIGMTLLWLQADDRRVQAEAASIAEGEATKLARANLARARWSLYVSRLQVARQELQEGRAARARLVLDSLRPTGDEPDLRGFEWHYLSCLCRLALPEFDIGLDRVYAVTYSPDGRLLAAAHRDAHAVSVWDVTTGERRWLLADRTMTPVSVTFSRDGRTLACSGYDFHVHFWDMQSGQPILPSWEMGTQPKTVAFSPTEDQIAVGERDGATVHDAATGKEIARMPMPKERVQTLSYSRDGRRLAGNSHAGVFVWDLSARKVVRKLTRTAMVGLALSPDGRFLAQRGGNNQITVHDLQANQSFVLGVPGVLPGFSGIEVLAWSPDSSLLAAGPDPDGTMRVWDIASRKEVWLHRVQVSPDPIWHVAFSPNSLRLTTVSELGTVRILRVSGEGGAGVSGPPRIDSPDGRRYYTWTGGTAKAWDAATHQELLEFEPVAGQLIDLLCSPDGAVLAGFEGRQVVLWDTASGRRLHLLPVPQDQRRQRDERRQVVFSPDGRWLAMPEYHETTEGRFEQHARAALAGPVVTSFNATIRFWDVATGREGNSLDCPFGRVTQLDFTPDGRHVLATAATPTEGLATAAMPAKDRDISVALWEASTRRLVWRLKVTGLRILLFTPFRAPAVAVSPDGRRIAVSVAERVLLVVDRETGKEQLRLATRGYPIPAFNADGSRVIAQQDIPGGRREVTIWDAATGEELVSIAGRGPEFELPMRNRDGGPSTRGQVDDYVDWDVAPHATEVWRNRDAALLVRVAFARSPWRDDVLDELRRAPGIDEAVRREALTQAQHRPMDPNALNDAARRIVGKPTAADLPRAAAMADEAVRLAQKNGIFLNTLGALQYRQGQPEQALETLLRSEKLNTSQLKSAHPADLAFLAMTAQKLNRTEEARQYLERLRTTMKVPTWAKNEEALQFLREAEDELKLRK
jgi:serine/threonine protein kinase/WD40 repeat protein